MSLSPEDLRDHLVRTRIAGDVATTRQDNLRNAGLMASGHVDYAFGLTPRRSWTAAEVEAVMVRRCGIDPDLDRRDGADTIDPDLTMAALERWRERLAKAAAGGERVLLATGHPTGVLAIHLAVAAALRTAGAQVIVPHVEWRWDPEGSPPSEPWRPMRLRALNGVHVLATGGELLHTHRPEPMRALLDVLDEQPDLVVADHGWAGAATEQGIETLGLADCNDPALFVAEDEGRPIVTVPLDDNVPPQRYDPISDYVTRW